MIALTDGQSDQLGAGGWTIEPVFAEVRANPPREHLGLTLPAGDLAARIGEYRFPADLWDDTIAADVHERLLQESLHRNASLWKSLADR